MSDCRYKETSNVIPGGEKNASMDSSSSNSKYTPRDLALLCERIDKLGTTEHGEIINILKRRDVNVTSNRNGVFVNISKVDDDILDEIHNFVVYCINNKTELDEYEKRINECKIKQEYTRIIRKKEDDSQSNATRHNTSDTKIESDNGTINDSNVTFFVSTDSNTTCKYDGKPMESDFDKQFVESNFKIEEDILRKQDSVKYLQAKKKFSKKRVEVYAGALGSSYESDDFLTRKPYIIE